MEKNSILVSSVFLLAAAFWVATLLPVGFIHASMIISPTPTLPAEQPTAGFQEVTISQPAEPIASFDPVEINNASDFIDYYFGGEGEAYIAE